MNDAGGDYVVIVTNPGQTVKASGVARTTREGTKSCSQFKRRMFLREIQIQENTNANTEKIEEENPKTGNTWPC